MSALATILILVGVVLLVCAAFVVPARVQLGWLGLALLALAVWLIPALNAAL